MKYLTFFWMLIILAGCVGEDQKGSVRTMTFNLRYDNSKDGINRWDNRRELAVQSIIDESPDIIGFQEVLSNQLKDLDSLLIWYDYVGVARDDGKEKGEFSPVFFKMDRFELLDHGTFWLSDHPDSIGSRGWDAALPRIATWAKFHDRHVRKDFMVLNTHFDHQGEDARKQSSRLLVRFLRRNAGELPFILSGDFNLDEEAEGYQILTTNESVNLVDTRSVSVLSPRGPIGTYTGFKEPEGTKRIDHIFISRHWKAYEHETLQLVEDGVYLSDHWPVITNLKIVPGS